MDRAAPTGRGLHWRRLLISAVVLPLALLTWWYVAAEDRVCLVVDGRSVLIRTRADRVGGLLRQAGVEMADGDLVTPAQEARIREGMTIKVRRSFPVDLVVGGETRQVKTVACTVGELLRACRIDLGGEDSVRPGLSQEVKPGQTVRVVRISTRQMTYREQVAPPVVTRKDGNMDRGVSKTIKEGSPGLVERTALVRFEDGRIKERRVLSTKWLRQPETRIVALGTRPPVYTMVTSRGHEVRYTKMMVMTATAYDPGPESCGLGAKGITRTGHRATYGVVAVDPKVIPLYTRLYVEGYGFATALDTGSAIKGNRVDLCYDTYREAIMYGKRKIKVYILAK